MDLALPLTAAERTLVRLEWSNSIRPGAAPVAGRITVTAVSKSKVVSSTSVGRTVARTRLKTGIGLRPAVGNARVFSASTRAR